MDGTVRVGIANEGEINIGLDIVEKWEPTNIKYFSEIVFFKVDNTLYSMNIMEFKKIFNK
jgi:hypothetical protein